MGIFFVLIIVWLSAGFYCGEVAYQKGYSGAAWAIGGFLFGFIALIAAAGLPDRKLRKYIRLIGEKQNAIEVLKEKVELVDGSDYKLTRQDIDDIEIAHEFQISDLN